MGWKEREKREVEKLGGSLKVKSAVLPAFSVSTRADSLLESGEMIFRARFIQIFVELDGYLLLLLLLFPFRRSLLSSVSLPPSEFLISLTFFLFFSFFSLPRSPRVEHGEKVCGEHKGSVHVRRARKRQNLPRESRREESVGRDKDDHKGDKDCLFGPADNWAAVGQCLFFVPLFPFQLRSICSIHAYSVLYSDFYLFSFFFPLISPRSSLFDRYVFRRVVFPRTSILVFSIFSFSFFLLFFELEKIYRSTLRENDACVIFIIRTRCTRVTSANYTRYKEMHVFQDILLDRVQFSDSLHANAVQFENASGSLSIFEFF